MRKYGNRRAHRGNCAWTTEATQFFYLADTIWIHNVKSESTADFAGKDPEKNHILPKLLLTLFFAIFTIPHRRLKQKCLPARSLASEPAMNEGKGISGLMHRLQALVAHN
jgi:hypothetical protein